eukprot:Phypoly_transcript_06674.p1 GENE.Phypoly_transcript_06674~~Phypoly_transcript_06674.p1  ORF type:complete len:493 (+),score=94.93 Phypoly_transcript_06674:117-1595(+)
MKDGGSWDVVVIGAGLSGCVAAYELAKSGLKVAILEANDRVGGRTCTVRAKDGNHVDLGGQWVYRQKQNHVMMLLEELEIKTYPQFHKGKKRLELKDGAMSEYASSIPSLPFHSLLDLQLNGINKFDNMSSHINVENPVLSDKAAELDSMTVADLANKYMWTPAARQMIAVCTQTILGMEMEDVSALYFLFYIKTAGSVNNLVETENGAQQDKIMGGTGQIFTKLLAKLEELGAKLFLDTPVWAIAQSQISAEIRAGDGDTEALFKAKRVIVAVSPKLVEDIEFSPPLPEIRRQIMRRGTVGSYFKCILFYSTPFWRKKGLSGQMVCYGGDVQTQPICLAYDACGHQMGDNWEDPWQEGEEKGSGRQCALVAFICGAYAIYWGEKEPAERRAAIMAHLARHFGEETKHPIDYLEKDWGKEKYTKGCPVINLPPGALSLVSRLSPKAKTYILREPVGVSHFAATETATEWVGYLDGAVQSGRRAAKEVLEAFD